MNLASLDLNLLVALRALLEERNVTRAGRRVGLSQPATSAALARLRRHFADELLVRTGNAYELTPLGTALLVPCATACGLLERLFTSRADFDPATEGREFTIIASDYAVAVFGAALARALHAAAPAARLVFQQVGPEIAENADATLSAVDGLLMPHGVVSGFPTVELYRDEWVCVVAADHPDIGDGLTMDDLAELPAAAEPRRGHPPRRPHPAPPRRAARADRGRPRPAVPVRGGARPGGAVVAPRPHPGRGPHLAPRDRRTRRRRPDRPHPGPGSRGRGRRRATPCRRVTSCRVDGRGRTFYY
ncbi:LysR family transcriptional regulator [Spirillospora sp. NPDC046719]